MSQQNSQTRPGYQELGDLYDGSNRSSCDGRDHFLLAINCWSLRQGLRAVDDQLNVLRETLQLEIHAIRDLMEETERRQKQRDADR